MKLIALKETICLNASHQTKQILYRANISEQVMSYLILNISVFEVKPNHIIINWLSCFPFKMINHFKPNRISIGHVSSFSSYGLIGDIFHFYSNFNRTLCTQTVETLIRCRVVWRLIWVCTVCLSPIKRMLGLCGLTGCPVFLLK